MRPVSSKAVTHPSKLGKARNMTRAASPAAVGKVTTVSLGEALSQNDELRHRIERLGDELAAINEVLGRELPQSSRTAELERTLDRSEDVESRIHESAEILSSINRGLAHGIADGKGLTRKLLTSNTSRAKAQRLALYDSLTGLANRLLFSDRLTQVLAQSERHARGVAVMFIDLDKFKKVNDSHGHDVGDRILQEVGQRLRGSLRAEDTVSRRGGDEFLCFVVEANDEINSAKIAEKIIRSVSSPIEVAEGIRISVKPSIGIAVYPRDGATVTALTKHADTAMYRAKRSRKGYEFFS